MTNQDKKYDLVDRTFLFARDIRDYVDKLPKKVTNTEIGRQLIRSAGSVGVNYVEAKESHYWLNFSIPEKKSERYKIELMCESEELMKIFAVIIRDSRA